MTANRQVIVALTDSGAYVDGRAKLRAALDTDPEVLVEQVARAAQEAYAEGLTRYTVIDGPTESNIKWVESLKWKDAARAAIACLCENPGQEGEESHA